MSTDEKGTDRMPHPVARALSVIFIMCAVAAACMVVLMVQLAITLRHWGLIPLALLAVAMTACCLLCAAGLWFGEHE